MSAATNRWFRMYAEFANDPKVQMLSEVMQRRLVMIFCLRCNDSLKVADDEEIAFSLRIDLGELEKTKDAFIKKGFVDKNWNPINWDKRQFLSDKSNSRVAKYREKRKELGLTSNGYTKHSVTVIERDGNCCVYCGSGDNLCIDHVLPVIQGGNDDIDNLVCACKECNSGKSGRTPMQAGYTFQNVDAKDRWERWIKENNVTVTVTPPEAEAEAEADTEVNPSLSGARESESVQPSRKGIVCGLLRKAGMADSAPHYLTDEVWETILAKRTNEEIVEVARAKMAAKPNERIGLKYIAKALLEDPKPIDANARASPVYRRQAATSGRQAAIDNYAAQAAAARGEEHERTGSRERDITGEAIRIA